MSSGLDSATPVLCEAQASLFQFLDSFSKMFKCSLGLLISEGLSLSFSTCKENGSPHFPGPRRDAWVQSLDCNVGDVGSIPGLGRSPGGRHGNPLQYSCLENPHGQRILAGYSSWNCKELDMTERLSTM